MRKIGHSGHMLAVSLLLATVAIGAQAPAPGPAGAPSRGAAPAAGPGAQGGAPARGAIPPQGAVPPPSPPATPEQIAAARPVLLAVREALGGDKRLSDVTSFVATGRTQQVQGANLVPIEFEILCELPDKYTRRDEIPARESGPTTVGFSADDLIRLPIPPAPPARAGAPTPTPAQLEAQRRAQTIPVKQDFARLTLGMFATSFSAYPLTFSYGGQAEAPQGKADVIDVKGAPNFALKYFVYRDTHLPIMVSWQTMAQGKPVENRIYYADYREVDGMKFPFRLRRAVGPDTVEETTFDRFKLNSKIDPKKFEVRK